MLYCVATPPGAQAAIAKAVDLEKSIRRLLKTVAEREATIAERDALLLELSCKHSDSEALVAVRQARQRRRAGRDDNATMGWLCSMGSVAQCMACSTAQRAARAWRKHATGPVGLIMEGL